MTLQQLKYAIIVAEKGTFNEASKVLFISQPSLSSAIKELEDELKINIFIRNNRGVNVSPEGVEFLGYARQVIQQSDLLQEKYLSGSTTKQKFSVSTHHYLFAANAFVDLIKEYGGEEYKFSFRETRTSEVIDDVKNLRSEIGIIYLSNFNESVISKLLKESELLFTQLFVAKPHVFLFKKHPLAKSKFISLNELDEYPCLTYEQGEQNSFYFSEEILSTRSVKKSIKMSDRAAMVNLMIGVNGYTICTGIFPHYLHGDDIVAVPLSVSEKIRVGTIMHKNASKTRLGDIYLNALKRIAENLDFDIDKTNSLL